MFAPRLDRIRWDEPLLPSAVRWLAGDWDGTGPLDLSSTLVLVPTRQSGRRLREALAGHAAARGQAAFPPLVLVAEALLARSHERAEVASRYDELIAWIEVLRRADTRRFAAVFPVPPINAFSQWVRLARRLMTVQETLAENGLRIGDVPALAGDEFPERERWLQLGELEAGFDAALGRHGLRPARVSPRSAMFPREWQHIRRVVLLANPDPLPLALDLLRTWSAERSLEIIAVAYGPPEGDPRDWFDEWGRPRPDVWSERPIAIPDFEQRVHVRADPTAQAATVTEIVGRYAEPEGLVAVGVLDPELAPALRQAFAAGGQLVYDPEGEPRRNDPLFQLLRGLTGLAADDGMENVHQLARCPDILEWLRSLHGLRFSPARSLAALDELQARHLPDSLPVAQSHLIAESRNDDATTAAAQLLDGMAQLRGRLMGAGFPANIAAALGLIFSGRRFDLTHDAEAAAVEAAEAWNEIAGAVAAAAGRFSSISDAETAQIALEAYAATPRFGVKPAGAIELQGWLELLWEDAPHLVIAGLNEGRVPAAIVGDAFLPEGLRQRLGLKTNEVRLARDAFLLQALAAGRGSGGQLDLLLGRTTAVGEPLRPSRLLFRCRDEELPQRVAFLFRDVSGTQSRLGWRRAWQLEPRTDARIERLRVTAFRDYLRCPFRFYLRHGLRMRPVDPNKTELDALDFGSLCHAALERLATDAAMRDCTDPARLRDFLIDSLDQEMRATFGSSLALPLLVQLESARQRLARAALVQAAERSRGWILERAEVRIGFALGGFAISGTVDRIDRHETSGEWRVLDYKTSDQPADPKFAHLRKAGRTEDLSALPPWALFQRADETLVWKDLQLPLYRRALGGELDGPVSCGYFNLPKAASETAILAWTDYDDECQRAADRCAEGIVAAVRARRFWPPADLSPNVDEFAALFHHGARESVRWPEADRQELAIGAADDNDPGTARE